MFAPAAATTHPSRLNKNKVLNVDSRAAYSHTERASEIVQCHPRTWVSGVIHFICLCASVPFVSVLSSTLLPKFVGSSEGICDLFAMCRSVSG